MRPSSPASAGTHDETDPVYAGFDIESRKPSRSRMENVWAPFLLAHGADPAFLRSVGAVNDLANERTS